MIKKVEEKTGPKLSRAKQTDGVRNPIIGNAGGTGKLSRYTPWRRLWGRRRRHSSYSLSALDGSE
jgi:hypothetical protein